MSLAAGRLRHKVEIQEQIEAKDSDGYPTIYWAEWATVWAAVEPLSVKEWMQSGQTQSQVSARITIRYRPGLKASMRILFRDKIYNIAGSFSDPVSGLEYLTLPVTEGTNDGE